MKNKILIIFMSFIFLATYTVNVWANVVENEINEKQENVELIEKKEEKEAEENQEIESNQEDVAQLATKIETEEKEIEVENTEEMNQMEMVGNLQYAGRMYIDYPGNQATFSKVDQNTIEMMGWAVSNDVNSTVQVLLDGNVLGNCPRTSRLDVNLLVSPEYGGVTNTPLAGFEYSLDIRNLALGTHTITVQELSGLGDLIASSEVIIQVQNKQYVGRMYIDYPGNQMTFSKVDQNIIEMMGWAVSNDVNSTVQVLLDGNYLGNCIRTSRGDVNLVVSPEYGGVENTPLAGFEYSLDIRNLALGTHTITVQELSGLGDLIVSSEVIIQIRNKDYRGTIFLDAPVVNTQCVKQEESLVKLQGWAVSEDREAVVKVFLDGLEVIGNCERMQRIDVDVLVSPEYGGVAITPNAGFYGEVNISGLGIGNHVLRIEEVSRFGDLINVVERVIHIVNQQYLGEMCLDQPQNGMAQNVGTRLTVAGWAVSQDRDATVEIYIDGKWSGTAARYYRADIVPYVNKYGGNTINAGFGKMIETSNMIAGNHKIVIYEKSKYGDVIAANEAIFVLKSNVISSNPEEEVPKTNVNTTMNTTINNTNVAGMKGIDVSQHQGTINWSQVASSEMKYVMIRIGYRGYGNGKLVEDSRFKTNFAGAVSNGLKVGIYFYSSAINAQEAKEDAEFMIRILKKYGYQNQVSMPIVIDLELVPYAKTRDENLSKSVRTSIANSFSQTVRQYGYTPMVYANKSFLNDNMNKNQISCDVWVAQYNKNCTYSGNYTMWQYTSSGRVPGISGNVDCNICYKNY